MLGSKVWEDGFSSNNVCELIPSLQSQSHLGGGGGGELVDVGDFTWGTCGCWGQWIMIRQTRIISCVCT